MGIAILALFLVTPLFLAAVLNKSILKLSLADEGGSGSEPPEVYSVPAVSYSTDLRRLGAEHTRLLAAPGEGPGHAGHLHAVEKAYDDTLRAACKALDLEKPPWKMDAATRLQVEADLMLHGLNW